MRTSLPGRIWEIFRRWPILPIIVLVALIVTGLFAPWVAPNDPLDQDLTLRNNPPFWDAAEGTTSRLLGADHVGRDVLSRVIYGARISLIVVGVSLSTGLFVGTTLGLIAGYSGGLVDEIIMRLVDVWLALPFVLIALVAVVVLGASSQAVWQMLPGCEFLEQLEALDTPSGSQLVSIAGGRDWIVPLRSTRVAMREGQVNHALADVTHTDFLLRRSVFACVAEELERAPRQDFSNRVAAHAAATPLAA